MQRVINIQPDKCPHCNEGHLTPCLDGDECSHCFYFRQAIDLLENVQDATDKPLTWGLI